MLYQAFAFPDECTARWQHLMEADGAPFSDDAPAVTTDFYDLADGLEAAGIKTNFVR